MKISIPNLQKNLLSLMRLLENENLLSLSQEQRRELRAENRVIQDKLASIETGYLTVGLLGGTGVGKSTIMNALADSEIASTSHRRPHTDKVLVYRHNQIHLSSTLSLERVPWTEIAHGADEIRHIILCDLPDFDSISDEHRQYVIAFLENLDLLIWASSPEKYADGRFYELLHDVPKAGENFIFVLNKMDLFFQTENKETGYNQMTLAADKFRALLKENRIRNPLLYVISAAEIRHQTTVSPWNQFPAFRQYVFQQRETKQILAIKAANLDAEVAKLMASFDEEIRLLSRMEETMGTVLQEIKGSRDEWNDTGRRALEPWLNRQVLRDVFSAQGRPEQLVGPGRGLALFFRLFKQKTVLGNDGRYDLARLQPPESTTLPFKRRLDWVRDRIESDLMLTVPSARELLHNNLSVENRFSSLGEAFFQATAVHAVDPPLPAFRFFRILQWTAYLILFGLFILTLGGLEAWQGVIENPGSGRLFNLFLSIIQVIFSTRGLAALGSYMLLNLFLGLRFYRSYQKRLDRIAQKRIELLKSELLDLWEQCLDDILNDLERIRSEAVNRKTALSGLIRSDSASEPH